MVNISLSTGLVVPKPRGPAFGPAVDQGNAVPRGPVCEPWEGLSHQPHACGTPRPCGSRKGPSTQRGRRPPGRLWRDSTVSPETVASWPAQSSGAAHRQPRLSHHPWRSSHRRTRSDLTSPRAGRSCWYLPSARHHLCFSLPAAERPRRPAQPADCREEPSARAHARKSGHGGPWGLPEVQALRSDSRCPALPQLSAVRFLSWDEPLCPPSKFHSLQPDLVNFH